MAYQQLVDFLSPKSVEMREGEYFLWKELMSLCCPFYQPFITWILSRVGEGDVSHGKNANFFSRFGECIEASSGSKEVCKEKLHKPDDFS